LDESTFRPDQHELTTALHELDAAKALAHHRRLELNNVISALSSDRPSSDELLCFKERCSLMNEAMELYHRAVGSFNAACVEERSTTYRALSRDF
jgi:hypothetical protein